MLAENELKEAEAFLEPVLRPATSRQRDSAGSISLTAALLPTTKGDLSENDDTSSTVSQRAVHLLEEISKKLLDPGVTQEEIELVLLTSNTRRVIDALLDLISIEGLYPYLLPGVGVPIENRMRSTWSRYQFSVERATDAKPRDTNVQRTINLLLRLCTQNEILASVVFERTVVDLLAILLQYSSMPEGSDAAIRAQLANVIQKIPLRYLYPSLTMLLRPASTPWMKVVLSTTLSRLPMRQDGLRQTLFFLASGQASSSDPGQQPSRGPLLTHELLERLARVVYSIPSSVTADDWFRNMASQLFPLLDSDDQDDQKVASFAIGAVLSRRLIGSPGTSGWKYMAEPVISVLNCDQLPTSDPSSMLRSAGDRLARIVTLHPNPGLLKRLTSRVLPTLWALACGPQSQLSAGNPSAAKTVRAYLKDAGTMAVMKLMENLDWDGPPSCQIRWEKGDYWRAVPSPRTTGSFTSANFLRVLEEVTLRVDILIDMTQDLDNAETSELCVAVFRKWMSSGAQESNSQLLSEHHQGSAHLPLVYLKFLQTLLEKRQQKLASAPQQFVPLVVEIIAEFLKHNKPQTRSAIGIESLAGITNKASKSSNSSDEALSMVGISLGLLSILLLDEQQFMSSTERPVCLTLKSTLEALSLRTDLPADIILPTKDLHQQLCDAMGISSTKPSRTFTKQGTQQDDASRHRAALDKIAAPEPPIRAEGLADLNNLVAKSSNVILVPPTILMLVALLKEDDEYTHLAAIRSLVVLGTHRTPATLTQLMGFFVDPSEDSSLDVRLKVAEGIQQIVANVGHQLDPSTANGLLQSAILVGGRRPQRLREAERRAKEARQEERKRRAAERSANISVPDLQDDEDLEEVTPADELASRLLEKWTGTGCEEDIRVRTSALSIIDTVLQQAYTSSQASSIEDLFGLIVGILRLERAEGEALLRRCAILCLQTLIGQAEAARPMQNAGHVLNAESLDAAMVCLEDEIRDESDDIARGHAMAVKATIEESRKDALEVKLRGEDIRFDLGGQLRGLAVNPDTSNRPRPKIQEIE